MISGCVRAAPRIKYFDLLFAQRLAAREAVAGFYFMGRKAHNPLTTREIVARYDGAVPDLYARRR
jgi:hypothetical protein